MDLESDRDNLQTQTIRRPSRLPWLLVLFLALGSGVLFYLGQDVLKKERERSVASLRESEEAKRAQEALEARLSGLEAENEKLAKQVDALSAGVSKKEAELEKLKAKLAEAQKAKSAKGKLARKKRR